MKKGENVYKYNIRYLVLIQQDINLLRENKIQKKERITNKKKVEKLTWTQYDMSQ